MVTPGLMLARKLRKKILLGQKNRASLSKETVMLIQDILKRRRRRMEGQSVPQTAHPGTRSSKAYNSEARPGTSPEVNAKEGRKTRNNDVYSNEFGMQKDALVDYDELSDA
eukprot:TRINITY_DN2101_c0_g3_i3.p2 TRINITY_DN2101_c0_g3~~TRINITY_DN2101_c0_g3_i3.p2  ORF type:complete len:111 (-),score=18.79 TRINITY_DN2101_c0_g3_i3:65-397(-)